MEHCFIYAPDRAIAETKSGKVRGYEYDGITIFKGIPYAKARRFHAPEPVERWDGIFEATSYGYVSPLLELPKPYGELNIPHRYWIMNEECQNLNVWTPACDGEKRPVMVWLHGGGFEAGSAIENIAYEGENMCRIGQVVVVSINHRLNLLGYFDLSAYGSEYANSGNAGTDDIIMALQWIQDNIANFGGDPENVTLFGQSGGGAKITTLLQTPKADGLFAKGINMSGVAETIMGDSKGNGEDLAIALMAELGIDGDIRELETISYESMAKAYLHVKPDLAAEGKYLGCTPHPNAFYKGTPNENGFRMETAHIPLLVGTVYGEFSGIIPCTYDKNRLTREEGIQIVRQTAGEKAAEELVPLFQAAYPKRNPVEMLSLDFLFRLPTQQYIRQRSAINQFTYSYLFNLDLPVNGGSAPWHCADIPYVFHNTELVPVTQERGVTENLEAQIFNSVIAFARTGKPNHEGIPYWPASTPEEEQTMVFGKNTQLRCNHDAKLIPLLAKYMEPVFERIMYENTEKIQH